MRSATFETDFLDGAQRQARSGYEFAHQVEQRLSEGQRLYGDRWAAMSAHRLLQEIREEGLDLGAWSALTAQHQELDGLDPERRQRAHLLLQEVAAHGAAVDSLVDQLRDELL